MGSVPSTFATGYKYAAPGLHHGLRRGNPALAARHAHQEFADTPCIDKGFYVLMGNNHYIMRSIQRGEHERARAFIGWLLPAPRDTRPSWSIPAASKNGRAAPVGNVSALDDIVDAYNITPRQIMETVARSVDELKLAPPGARPLQ